MTTYKDKLIDLLKSDDEVKTAIEKLEFGCKIKYSRTIGIIIDNEYYKEKYEIYTKGENGTEYIELLEQEILKLEELYDYEIIGLPLQERFLRMYLKNKGIENTIIINTSKLDHNRDFDNQDDDIYQKIYEVINNLITK